MRLYKRTYYIFLNELRTLLQRPMPIVAALIAPILAGLVITLVMSEPDVENLPMVVVDNDNTALSRMLVRSLDGNPSLQVTASVANEAIAEEMVRRNEAYYLVVIPKDFSEKIKSGRGSKVEVVIDGGNLIYAKLGLKAIGQTVSNISTGINITRLKAKGLTREEAFDKAVPIQNKLKIMGNPYVDYSLYLVPGMILSLLQMSASFSTLWIFRTKQMGKLLPSYGNLLPFLVGKTMPIFLANLIAVIIVFTVILPIAGVTPNGAYFNLFLLTVFYVCVSMGIGFVGSLIFKDAVFSAQFLLVINSPVFVFSGYTFPTWAMPKFLEDFTYIIPVKHYFDGFFPMFVYGKTTEQGILPLFILGTILWGSAVILLVLHNYMLKVKHRKGALAV